MEETICAISTAPGVGGIAVIRVSGIQAIAICDSLFKPAQGTKKLAEKEGYTLGYGLFVDGDETVDEVVAALFRAPHSYTGEDSVEISCHGSTYIQERILRSLIGRGCRLAGPGEFTRRAFLNGKMDLSQAEAVADLIASTSAGQHRLAMNQMRGGFSRKLKELREQLLHITSLMELELDFSDHEELEFADRTELNALAVQIEGTITRLTHSFKIGNAIKNGVPVAIVGETNAGKSTLLNLLLGEEKAIVSDIHGTTRDVIEDTVNISGTVFRFIDTAGIRETDNPIESIGIERTFQKLDQAEIILWLVDASDASTQITQLGDKILPRREGKQLILVLNKSDLLGHRQISLPELPADIWTVSISAKANDNIDLLQSLLVKAARLPSLSTGNDPIVSNLRHYEALVHALAAIRRVRDGLVSNLSGDFISQDLRECIFHLSDIVGEVTTDQVLGRVFERFCIGK